MAVKLTKLQKSTMSRLLRQLGERGRAVSLNQRKPQYYTNKHKEFVAFIDSIEGYELIEGRRMWKLYHDKWD